MFIRRFSAMRKVWKPISLVFLSFLLVATFIVYTHIDIKALQTVNVSKATKPVSNQLQCATCQSAAQTVKLRPNITSNDLLTGVAADATTDAWAVGYSFSTNTAIIEHWNGLQWSMATYPTPGVASRLFAVTIVSATDVWVVGDYTPTASSLIYQTLTEHWNGTAWTVMPSPNNGIQDNTLSSVTALTTTNVWAVGTSQSSKVSLIEHWNGTTWSIIASPNPGTYNILKSVKALTATSIWTQGGYSSNGTIFQLLTEYWDGHSWQVVTSPQGTSSSTSAASGIGAIAYNNIWSFTATQNYLEHWDGALWSTTILPANETFQGMTRVPGTSTVWVVGATNVSSSSVTTLINYWDGTQWDVVSSPNPTAKSKLNAVTATSANDVWAVGYSVDASGNEATLIEHWDGAAWSVVASPNP
jgi:hypothetical protein